jgi:hypothetical protein
VGVARGGVRLWHGGVGGRVPALETQAGDVADPTDADRALVSAALAAEREDEGR